MSILFGLLKKRNEPVHELELQRAASATERYATGMGHMYVRGHLGMGLQPYFSHQRSEAEVTPFTDAFGSIISFDGRLDNYKELIHELDLSHSENGDSRIVLVAFERWGQGCFSHLVGDWALALWSEKEQALYLARDHAGTRTLYFHKRDGMVFWSTYLDTFAAIGMELKLADAYVARYLTASPVRDLTPYRGISSVPPAHCLVFRDGVISRFAHWDSTVSGTIRYKSDSEYDAHFLALFGQSVQRRTAPGAPILAQLSGGMDSTAIVCMSDHLRRSHDPHAEILDTVSFYDDSESSLNERPYFTITESRRGKAGTHFDTAFSLRTFEPHDTSNGAYFLPGADRFSFQFESRFDQFTRQKGYRSILSGIGGDEVLGGVPIAFPELADYLVSGDISRLLRRSIAWSLVDRSPLLSTLYQTTRYTIDLYSHTQPNRGSALPWISAGLRTLSRDFDVSHRVVRSRLGIAPHRLDNSLSWWSIMETLPHLAPQILARHEYRYPFLDKDLINFLFSIPHEQILQPGRRRALMRRALINIVPREILERRRKAFQLRSTLDALRQAHSRLEAMLNDSILAQAGYVDSAKLQIALKGVVDGNPEWRRALMRTIALELWLKAWPVREAPSGQFSDGGLHLSLTA